MAALWTLTASLQLQKPEAKLVLQLYKLRLKQQQQKSGRSISQMGSNTPVRSYVDHIALGFCFLIAKNMLVLKKQMHLTASIPLWFPVICFIGF